MVWPRDAGSGGGGLWGIVRARSARMAGWVRAQRAGVVRRRAGRRDGGVGRGRAPVRRVQWPARCTREVGDGPVRFDFFCFSASILVREKGNTPVQARHVQNISQQLVAK